MTSLQKIVFGDRTSIYIRLHAALQLKHFYMSCVKDCLLSRQQRVEEQEQNEKWILISHLLLFKGSDKGDFLQKSLMLSLLSGLLICFKN